LSRTGRKAVAAITCVLALNTEEGGGRLGTESSTHLKSHHVVGLGGSYECFLTALVGQTGFVNNTKVVVLLTVVGKHCRR